MRISKRWVAGLAVLALGTVLYRSLPHPLFRDPYATVVLDRDGRMLGAKIAADGQWRFPPLQVCPPRFATAAMAYEDRRFLRHPGVDPFAVARAVRQNLKSGKVLSGGSTLTMQVIRMSRGSRGPRARTWPEKFVEAFLALRLELGYRKPEIMAFYASHAPFGGNVVGLEAASWRYFGRPADRLSWGEASLLAVLPNSPSLMHPGRNREPLRRKRDRLLARLWRQGSIDSVTCALARLEPLPDKPVALPRAAPHLVERLAKDRPAVSSGPSGLAGPAAILHTSLEGRFQAQVDEILLRRQRELDGQGIRNGAVLVLRVATGEVMAYAGNMRVTGNGAGDQGAEVDIITSRRSTGSLLKPFLYASMLEAGELLPGTLIADVPTQIGGYSPENFDRGFEGAVPARLALARSLNVPAVRMLKGYGVERFYRTLKNLGFTTLDRPAADYGLTLVLGGAEGTLWDLCGMYAGLAREAMRYSGKATGAESLPGFFPPRLSRADAPIPSAAPIGPASAWLALQAMAEVSRPDAQKYWRSFASSRWVAWKTGTSFGFRDAWAVGVTPEYVVGVWVGNASGQGRPGMTGIQVAAPLLFDVYNALPPTSEFTPPMASLMRMAVCPSSGMRPGPICPVIDSVWAPQAGLRTAACPYHRMVHLDSEERFQVHDGCQSISAMRHRAWFILPPTQEWYYRQRHSDYLPPPDWRKDCEAGLASRGMPRAMDLIYPKALAGIYIPTDLNAEKSRAIFEAVHRDPGAIVYWHLDHAYLGETREFHKMMVNPSPGMHTLLLVDGKGERLERKFEVLAKESGR